MRSLCLGFFILLIFSCSRNNVKEDKSLEKYFLENKVHGTFALMENATGKFTVYNLKRYRDSSYLPASTFKIINSLIGLQTGRITNDSMRLQWDGIDRGNAEWNKDLTMYEAFRVSAVWYYQEIARRIGKDTMQFWLDSISYGNRKLDRIDSFWLNNTMKISSDEQLGLVKRLYFDQLPFFKSYQEMVKRAMLIENNSNYRLGYKTGWGFTESGNSLGWVVGWIEENNHPYFFVLNIETPDRQLDMRTVRIKMLKDILKELGFFEGKM